MTFQLFGRTVACGWCGLVSFLAEEKLEKVCLEWLFLQEMQIRLVPSGGHNQNHAVHIHCADTKLISKYTSSDLGVCRAVLLMFYLHSFLVTTKTVPPIFVLISSELCYHRDITNLSHWPSLGQQHISIWSLQGLALLDIEEPSSSFSQKSPLPKSGHAKPIQVPIIERILRNMLPYYSI